MAYMKKPAHFDSSIGNELVPALDYRYFLVGNIRIQEVKEIEVSHKTEFLSSICLLKAEGNSIIW